MVCPKCMGTNVTAVGTTHYICNNSSCTNNGVRTQFKHVLDDELHFPYNQIYVTRTVNDFYRKPYLELNAVSATS